MSDFTESVPNEHGVLVDTEDVILAEHKRYRAIANLAFYNGLWYAGHDFNGPDFGSGSPASIRFPGSHLERIDALTEVVEDALKFFSNKDAVSGPVPAKFLKQLEDFRSGLGNEAEAAGADSPDADVLLVRVKSMTGTYAADAPGTKLARVSCTAGEWHAVRAFLMKNFGREEMPVSPANVAEVERLVAKRFHPSADAVGIYFFKVELSAPVPSPSESLNPSTPEPLNPSLPDPLSSPMNPTSMTFSPGSLFSTLNLANLQEDASNTRTRMSATKLDNLKESIRRWGVRQPLEVYLVSGDESDPVTALYEVVTGNRRLRATNRLCAELREEGELDLLARRVRVPVKILSAEEVEEKKYLQMIENLQREDVDPLDEATGLRWLVENHHDTPASLATTLGVGRNHIYCRLRLPDAPKLLLDALTKGTVSAKHCELVGGIPGEVDREMAAHRVLNPQYKTEPLTAEETRDMIRRDFMISLRPQSKPGFDLEDGDLVPAAGACSGCSFLARNAEEVRLAEYGAKGRGVDGLTCLNPACARSKRQAALANMAALAEAEALSEEVCAKVFGGMHGEVSHDAEYVPLATLSADLQEAWQAPTFLGRNPTTGEPVFLVDRSLADEAVSAAKGAPAGASSGVDDDGESSTSSASEGAKSRRKDAVVAMESLMMAIFSKGMTESDIDALTATELQETPAALAMFRAWLKPKAKADGEAIQEMMEMIGSKGVGASTAYLALSILAYGLSERGPEDPSYRAFADRFGV